MYAQDGNTSEQRLIQALARLAVEHRDVIQGADSAERTMKRIRRALGLLLRGDDSAENPSEVTRWPAPSLINLN